MLPIVTSSRGWRAKSTVVEEGRLGQSVLIGWYKCARWTLVVRWIVRCSRWRRSNRVLQRRATSESSSGTERQRIETSSSSSSRSSIGHWFSRWKSTTTSEPVFGETCCDEGSQANRKPSARLALMRRISRRPGGRRLTSSSNVV